MNNDKKYVLTAKIDEKMNVIIAKLKEKIRTGVYGIKDWDCFLEASILVFQKIVENGITPFVFDTFVEAHKKERNETKEFDA